MPYRLQKIFDIFSTKPEIAGQSIHISSSIGIAVFPDHGSDENLLLKNADIAMDNAKIKGGNGVQIYQTII